MQNHITPNLSPADSFVSDSGAMAGISPHPSATADDLPSPAQILHAAETLQALVHHTPVLRSSSLNQMFGCELFFKAEHLQKTGAFKYRGANYALSQLAAGSRGVATHSSGNHGAALAAAARLRGIPAHVVMPENSAKCKIAAVRAYGGEIHFCAPNQAAREAGLAQLVAEGYNAIPPFDDPHIISGQGTATWELLQAEPDLDAVITPVGGGGLYAGSLLASQLLAQPIPVWGAEPLGADDAQRSLAQGQRVSDHQADTMADGLRTLVGERNFALIQRYSPGIISVSEEEIIAAMRLLWTHLKQVVEPSSATVLAALAQTPERFAGKRVGLVLSGGNVDLESLPF